MVLRYPPAAAVTISMTSLAWHVVVLQRERGTTSPFSATAMPFGDGAMIFTTSSTPEFAGTEMRSPFNKISITLSLAPSLLL